VSEGSVRKSGNRVRITGQLIDTSNGAHIWADRFDGQLSDVFDLQDEVASSVAGAIEPKLRHAEIERASRKPAESLDAYDLYLRALARVHRFTSDSLNEAVALLRRALAIDPSYCPAAALLGWCFRLCQIQGWGVASQAEIEEAVRLARQAAEAGRDDPDVIWQAATTLGNLAGERALGAALVDRAVLLNPNAANAWTAKGWIHALANQPEPAIEALERARRLSPLDPLVFWNATATAVAHLAAHHFEQAIQWADLALRDQPRFTHALRTKVVANVHLGRIDEVRVALGQLLAINPETITGWRATMPGVSPALIELAETALRVAGLPEE
jgi:adenylate cyclase